MPKGKKLVRSSLRGRAKTLEEARREMVGSRYGRYNFMLTHADNDFLDEMVKRIRNETGLETSKSALVRIAVNKLKGMSAKEILGI